MQRKTHQSLDQETVSKHFDVAIARQSGLHIIHLLLIPITPLCIFQTRPPSVWRNEKEMSHQVGLGQWTKLFNQDFPLVCITYPILQKMAKISHRDRQPSSLASFLASKNIAIPGEAVKRRATRWVVSLIEPCGDGPKARALGAIGSS